jgi:cation-transporting ATPase I
VLAGIVQTPGLSLLFGCTPLGPVGWTIAGSATVAATAVTALLPLLSQVALPGMPSTPVHQQAAEPSVEPSLLATAAP